MYFPEYWSGKAFQKDLMLKEIEYSIWEENGLASIFMILHFLYTSM